jgi:hypothetical protein
MTRTDVMASSRPHTAGAAPMRRGSSGIARRLWIVPAMLLLVLALAGPTAAFAEEPKSNYGENAPAPSTGTAPSKESKTPTTTPTTEPAPSTEPAAETQASTLPFTGFDLRWSLAIGVLLMGAGVSIVAVQRRQSRGDRR